MWSRRSLDSALIWCQDVTTHLLRCERSVSGEGSQKGPAEKTRMGIPILLQGAEEYRGFAIPTMPENARSRVSPGTAIPFHSGGAPYLRPLCGGVHLLWGRLRKSVEGQRLLTLHFLLETRGINLQLVAFEIGRNNERPAAAGVNPRERLRDLQVGPIPADSPTCSAW